MLCFNQKSLDGLMEFFDKKSVMLLDHGQDPIKGVKSLRKFFKKGFENATTYMSMTLEKREARKKAKVSRSNKRILLHIPYHPQNPSSG